MTKQAFAQGDWQAVINAHPLESHDPEEWLRYGVALLQTLEPGEDAAKQLQQAALAFVQAQKEGATPEDVAEAQRQSAQQCLKEALATARLHSQGPSVTPTDQDAALLEAINVLNRLYNLTLAQDMSPLEQLADVKQQLNQRGLSSEGVRLGLDHARHVDPQLTDQVIAEVVRLLR